MKTKSILFCLLFALCGNISITVKAQVNVQDSLALVALYNSTNGPGWLHHDNWLTGPVSTWYGIYVYNTRVYSVGLSNNQLSGSMPPELGNLRRLYTLMLDNNQLSGSIPPELGNLANIGNLYLSDNQLSGSIPSELGNLANLSNLGLSFNQLSGNIPPQLGKLARLSYLFLNDNQLSGSIPPELGNIVNLNGLNLSNNRLTGNITPPTGNFAHLYHLYLDHNKLSGNISSAIIDLPLQELDLSYNRFTFDGMELVAQKFPFAVYGNQANIPVHLNNNALSVSAGGTLSNNTYRWYMAGQSVPITIVGDSVFHPAQSGKYIVRVRNSVATGLVLKSYTISYTAPPEFTTTNAIAAYTANAAQSKNGANMLLVYPNPAKDILHVKTNGKASFSLSDQAGKIMLTKTLNGKGSINVFKLAAGLYYLKNNSSGAVQKVIVER